MIELERDGGVFTLHMREGENRFNPDFLTALNRHLDEIESVDGAAALVTIGEGKFYSNGLDLEWMEAQEPERTASFLADVHALFARVLAFPAITVAAVSGHAFAGGAMLALAHDFRVMRADRGYFCLPEIDLGLPLTPGMTALIQAKLPRKTWHEAVLTGRRYGGSDAEGAGIVHDAVTEAEVLPRALEIARPLAGKHRPTLAALKRGLYPRELEILTA